MATVTYKPYNGGQIHAERTNAYICDGHGTEVLARTNRYLTDGHGLNTGCVGVNCPSDPALATAIMEQLRAQYEHNRGDRGMQGVTAGKTPVAHYQLVVSWHTDEDVPPEERYEMGRELIDRTKLADHAVLMAAHDNTDEDHLHLSVSAFNVNGTHKLCMNNTLLYDLRREMDRICVERGYSIVQAPELWGDPDYKAWFEDVKAKGTVTVHPPLLRRKRSKKQQYANAKKAEREQAEERIAELRKPVTLENRGTRGYGLPHVYHPARPHEQLYINALDKDGNRRSPLQLDFGLMMMWAKTCMDRLEGMPERDLKRSISRAYDKAFRGLMLVEELDIGTRNELDAHTKAVGRDISRYRREIAYQGQVIATARENGDRVKIERATARLEHAEQMLEHRKKEYRELKEAAATLDSMDTGEHWEQFRRELLRRSTKRVSVTGRREQTIRDNYRDIGQLLSIPQADIDRIIDDAKGATMDELEARWNVMDGPIKITYSQRKSGLSAIYEYVGDAYAERRKIRDSYYQLKRDFPATSIICSLLYLVLVLPFAKEESVREQEINRRITMAKRVAEEIRWHNQICDEQFKRAKSAMALKLALYEGAEADQAWADFAAECDRLIKRTRALQEAEAALAGDKMERSSVRDLSSQIAAAKAIRDTSLDGRKKDPTLDR